MTASLNHSPKSLIELLHNKAQQQPEQTAYKFLLNGETESSNLTYLQLDRQAKAIASKLLEVTQPGDRALLLYPSSLEFIAAFFGCLYAKVIAVPAYPPKANQNLLRLLAIVADATASVALTTTSLLSNLQRRWAENLEMPSLPWLATDSINSDRAECWQEQLVTSDTLAFLQYTSGSTGNPKGVMISHGNLLHNECMIEKALGHNQKTITVGWLPLFHDMGLVGNVLQPLYLGRPCILMSPVDFLQKPYRWLDAISRYKATTSGGPNFAYDLCVRKITPEQRATLDLSSWNQAFTGAEPIRAETLEAFAHTFAECGFRREAFYPCYGMAEATLFVTGGIKTEPPIIQTVDAQALAQNRVVTASLSVNAKDIVGCGRSWFEQKVVIVDPESLRECPSGQVGEIWISGPSVAGGYWNRPEETEKTFKAYLADTREGPFLRTGDLGFLKHGELFVTGRLKDMMIIRGGNYYPQDIEATVEQSYPSLRPSCSAAFSVEVTGEERLVVVAEVERRYLRDSLNVKEAVLAIRQAVSEQHGLQVYAVLLLKTGTIPKTSSGKIQRHACRNGFLNGTLDVVTWIENSITDTYDKQDAVEPSQATENLLAWLISQISQRLQVKPQDINIREPVSRYGLDSVQAVLFVADLEQYLGRKLSSTLLYDYPTIETLIQYLVTDDNTTKSNREIDAPGKTEKLDLNAEAFLDPTIGSNMVYVESGEPGSILLTGATGFLGAFLLEELLQQTSADIYCLVRADNTKIGKLRIQNNLEYYGIWNENFISRIIPVLGDLSQPQLGLANEEFQTLASKVDIIYHSAASLNFVVPYYALKPINVLGTQEILRLACQTKIKPVHYISSISVFESTAYANQVVTESDSLVHSEGIYMGYSQSKWVAEKLVMAARDRGLPVCIYRPPLIAGHSETGAWYTDDFICRVIKGGIQMGSVPSLDIWLDISPVDYVSKAIVYLSRHNESLGKAFHLMNPHGIHWSQFVDWMKSFGYPVQSIPYENWQLQLNKSGCCAENPLYPLLPFFIQKWSKEELTMPNLYEKSHRPQFSVDNTLAALSGSNIVCPPVDSQLLHIYFSYFIRSGFLAQPIVRQGIDSQLRSQSPQIAAIQTWLVSQISQECKVKPDEIDIRQPLSCYGLDSVQAVSIVAALEDWLGCQLSHSLLEDYPNIEALSKYLVAEFPTNQSTSVSKTGGVKNLGWFQKAFSNLIWSLGRPLYRHWFQMNCQGIENIPQDEPFLIAANHTSHLDVGAVTVSLRNHVDRVFSLGAKDYFFDHPIKGWFFSTFFNLIPFERQGNFLEAMRYCQQVLAQRQPVLIFPEGTRSLTGEIQPFQPGIGLLALKLNVPIVPMYIIGAYQALPKGQRLPRRHPIRVICGAPLYISPYKAKLGALTEREISQLITEDLQNLIVQLREGAETI